MLMSYPTRKLISKFGHVDIVMISTDLVDLILVDNNFYLLWEIFTRPTGFLQEPIIRNHEENCRRIILKIKRKIK